MNSRPNSGDLAVTIPTLGQRILQGCLQPNAGGSLLPMRVVVDDQSMTWRRDLPVTQV